MSASCLSKFAQSFKLPAALFALLVPFSINAAQSISAESSAQIRGVLDAQVAAWNRGDIDAFMEGYDRSSKTEFVSGDKLTRGWQIVRDNYKAKYNSPEKMGRLTFSELVVRQLSADDAFVIGRWQLVRKEDRPHGRFTLIFHRTPRGWRIVHDHTS